ncbi:MAG: XRE family transcriptional regulator [Acidobacteria bacterium]|nr:MAG: XRE family transcriptional regulator [Acidobacteriota bacterium]
MKGSNLGTIVKWLRQARGWNQTELAKRARLTQGYVAKLENPQYSASPSLDVVLRLARALGVDIRKLVKPSRARRV